MAGKILLFFDRDDLETAGQSKLGIYVYDRIADDRIRLEKSNDRMGTK